VFSLIICIGLYYLASTMNFMDKIMSSDYQIEKYYLIVLNDINYKNKKDIDEVGVNKLRNEYYEEALEKLKTNNLIEYKDIILLGEDLLENKIESLFISESYLSIIKDELNNFEENTKIIETIKVKVKNEVENKSVDVTKEPFNIYISGIDIYGDISSVSRSDVNMVVTVNPETHKILLTSIPRDYYVRLHGTTGYKDKLTHAGLYGIDMSIQTIEDLLEIDINYYVRVNFTTLIELVDAIGGIEVYSDYDFISLHGKHHFKKGKNELDGNKALCYIRERYAFKDGDRQRVKNQQTVLTAIINKTLSSKTLVTKYNSILKTLGDSFETSIPSNQIYDLINMQLDKMPSWDIEQISLDGTNSSNYTYSYSSGKLYVMEPNQDTIYEAKLKIKEISYEK